MVSLGEDGLLKVKAGITTPQELLRVVTEVRHAPTRCPECAESISADFVACPYCGHHVGRGCLHCGKPVKAEWKFCPFCARSTAAGKRGSKKPAPRRGFELPAAGNVAEFKK
jgi:RNA polymerase subunit RPABC4/transcription elongation factor Spt4